jgi:competence protein ComEA
MIEVRFEGAPGADIAVYVTGAVNRPGVYRLREGDRTTAAIEAAGGATSDADLDRVNLARRLRDEDQIYVPRIGEPGRGGTDAVPGLPASVIDINTASLTDLDALPGIGPVLAQRIIESRQRDGKFQTIEELVERKILTRATYDRIKDRITARP